MKTLLFLALLSVIFAADNLAQVGINTDGSSPDVSAIPDVKSTRKGFLPPRMTSAQRDSITSPASGSVIYNTDLNCLEFFTGPVSGWNCPCSSFGTINYNETVVHGTYFPGVILTPSNNITVLVNVLKTGGFQITSYPVNGYYFYKCGTFTSTGAQAVDLPGSGTPVNAGSDEFTLNFGSSACNFPVVVQNVSPVVLFRSGIFLHHSTGGCIWGPNGAIPVSPCRLTSIMQPMDIQEYRQYQ